MAKSSLAHVLSRAEVGALYNALRKTNTEPTAAGQRNLRRGPHTAWNARTRARPPNTVGRERAGRIVLDLPRRPIEPESSLTLLYTSRPTSQD